MISPESTLNRPQANFGKLPMPAMPGVNAAPPTTNPFAGIRRAGQAKRAMNFAKFQGSQNQIGPTEPSIASLDGAKNQLMGGAPKSQFGSTKPPKF